MFVLYAVVAGIGAGLLLGGRLERLDAMRLRWTPLALGGLIVQVILFSGPVGGFLGDLSPFVYVASTGAVLIFVLRNLRINGLPIVAVGAALNLAAIVANGGFMPAAAEALAAAGRAETGGYSNSVVRAAPALRPLTDIFALPAGLPLANVFSIGDVLIGLGVAVAIALAMRAAPAGPELADPAVADPEPTPPA